MRCIAWGLLAMPLSVMAAGGGAWQAQSGGVVLSHRGVAASSSVLSSAAPAQGTISLVAWRYELDAPQPPGLMAKLCTSPTYCVALDGQGGTTHGFDGQPAVQSFYFVWAVTGGGTIFPVMRVRLNQVIVNYQ